MIPELGNFALILALLLSVVLGTLPIIGAARNIPAWTALARPVAQGMSLFVGVAWGCLVYVFMVSDFSVLNVATNSNSQLPAYYRFAATWGSHEGSMLLWVFMLAFWTLAVSLKSRHLPDDMVARVLGVMGLVTFGFLLFMLLTSNPFDRLFPVPADGRDLNPLLQDPGMVIHPPMLYMGYVGFSVAFAFAIAAMIGGRVDAAWTRWARPWTIAAWGFLTIGIALGSAWAYYELGWGGWWFWDPVENASFMPWLVGTALMHSLVVTERRGAFKAWTLLLAIAAFSLSLLGTFLVRSGVLTTVHAFATDPARGIFILGFLMVVVGGSLVLFAWRAPSLAGNVAPGSFSVSSREGYLLANNVLMAVAAAAVFLGTLYPLVLDTLELGKISVGPPYFDAVFFPLMAPAMFLMAIGPFARWRNAPVPDLWQRLRWALLVAVLATILIRWQAGAGGVRFLIGVAIGVWVIAGSVALLLERLEITRFGRATNPPHDDARPTLLARARALPGGFWGMLLAHVGVGVFALGIAGVNTLQTEADRSLAIGEQFELDGYRFRLLGLAPANGPNYTATRGRVEVTTPSGGSFLLEPEKRRYNVQQSVMTEAAIDSGFTRDVYVSLGEPLPDGRWTVKAWIKPFIDWIWFGCTLMALGGFIALSDRRYRSTVGRRAASPASGGARAPIGGPVPPSNASASARSRAAT